MESGLYASVFSSWEVIVACLVLILLLPLVFFVASTQSRRSLFSKPARGQRQLSPRGPDAAAPGRTRSAAPRGAGAANSDQPSEDSTNGA